MSRWQIKSLLFYSHHGQRVVIDLALSAVNIIVGVNYSGKSALVEVIDYCMGAGECHIPGLVRDACSWVGVLWAKEKTEIVICRRVPAEAKSSADVYFAIGAPVEVPGAAAGLRRSTNADGALRQFEQALLMAQVVGETFTERSPSRISFRNALPYVLQSDDVIIDKLTLFRGANDERRMSIIDSLPYFLGAVDESTARAEGRLRQLRSDRDKEERRVEAARAAAEQELGRAKALLQEGAELGLAEPPQVEMAADALIEALRAVAAWTPEVPTVGAEGMSLPDLQRQERGLVSEAIRIRSQLTAANEALKSAEAFSEAVQSQRGRLDIVGLFRQDGAHETCPVCDAPIEGRGATLAAITEALGRLGAELQEVEQDRPQIDSYARRLEGDIAETNRQIALVRGQIAAVIREAEGASDRLSMEQRRLRVAGRVSYYLEAREEERAVDSTRLDQLNRQVGELEQEVDLGAKMGRLEALQGQVSDHIAAILEQLPFDEHYRGYKPLFDARKLSLRFSQGPRVLDMRDIGGDESYLSGHVSTLLALHRVFAEGQRPVPGVIVFDQLSRPFFPPDTTPGEVLLHASDREDLKQYFDVLFEEVAKQQTLQVLVLEHAYFADDQRYLAAVRRRWTESEKLIPSDWPKGEPGVA